MQEKQQGLRVGLRNNQREIARLIGDYQNVGAIIVTGHDVPNMDDWVVNDRPIRSAAAVRFPEPLGNTQATDASTQPSQPSMADSKISDAAYDLLPIQTFQTITRLQVKLTKMKNALSTQKQVCLTPRPLIPVFVAYRKKEV